MTDRPAPYPSRAAIELPDVLWALGLLTLLVGALMLLNGSKAPAVQLLLPAATAATCWWAATYFTLKRGMVLTSIVLTTGFGVSIFYATLHLPVQHHIGLPLLAVAAFIAGMVAGVCWYRRYRVPFSAFLVGAFPALAILSSRALSANAIPDLVLGLTALTVGLWLTMRDPHRTDSDAKTASWCHLLAGLAFAGAMWLPAMDKIGPIAPSNGLIAAALLAITVWALVIDQQALLAFPIAITAFYRAIHYPIDPVTSMVTLALLWAGVIALGLWWHPIRTALMRTLPNFPGKSRLPPYGPTE